MLEWTGLSVPLLQKRLSLSVFVQLPSRVSTGPLFSLQLFYYVIVWGSHFGLLLKPMVSPEESPLKCSLFINGVSHCPKKRQLLFIFRVLLSQRADYNVLITFTPAPRWLTIWELSGWGVTWLPPTKCTSFHLRIRTQCTLMPPLTSSDQDWCCPIQTDHAVRWVPHPPGFWLSYYANMLGTCLI